MRLLILISLCTCSGLTYAQKPIHRAKRAVLSIPDCQKSLLNLSELHDPVRNTPFDHEGINGQIGHAPLSVATFERASRRGLFLMGADERGAYLVQPQQRALIDVQGFRARIPRRDLRDIEKRKAEGFTTTHDERFELVVENCSLVPRRTVENDVERYEPTWITEKIKREYMMMHLHPDELAHSVEVWWGGKLVGGLFITFVDGVPMGESMFFDRTVATSIGMLALYALLERLEAEGHPQLDLQTMNPLLRRWGAYYANRHEHVRLRDAHAKMNLSYGVTAPRTP